MLALKGLIIKTDTTINTACLRKVLNALRILLLSSFLKKHLAPRVFTKAYCETGAVQSTSEKHVCIFRALT